MKTHKQLDPAVNNSHHQWLAVIEKNDPLGWFAINAIQKLSESCAGGVVACIGAGNGYFGKVAIDGTCGIIKSIARLHSALYSDDGAFVQQRDVRASVINTLINQPRPMAVVIRDIDVGLKLVDSILAISRKKRVESVFLFWRRGYGYCDEAAKMLLLISAHCEMEISYVSKEQGGEVLFVISKRPDVVVADRIPVATCSDKAFCTSNPAG